MGSEVCLWERGREGGGGRAGNPEARPGDAAGVKRDPARLQVPLSGAEGGIGPACRRPPRPGSDPPGGQRRGRARQPAEVWAAAAVIAVGLLSSRKTQGAWFKQQKTHPIDMEGRWWARRQGDYLRRVRNAIALG